MNKLPDLAILKNLTALDYILNNVDDEQVSAMKEVIDKLAKTRELVPESRQCRASHRTKLPEKCRIPMRRETYMCSDGSMFDQFVETPGWKEREPKK